MTRIILCCVDDTHKPAASHIIGIFVLQDEGLVENHLESEVNEKILLRQQLYELREQRLVFRLASFQPSLNTSLHFHFHSEFRVEELCSVG